MPIAGVVILTQPEKSQSVLNQLKGMPGVTTYGIHKENYIITVLEGDTLEEMKSKSEQIMSNVPGILGVYPSYINVEDELE